MATTRLLSPAQHLALLTAALPLPAGPISSAVCSLLPRITPTKMNSLSPESLNNLFLRTSQENTSFALSPTERMAHRSPSIWGSSWFLAGVLPYFAGQNRPLHTFARELSICLTG